MKKTESNHTIVGATNLVEVNQSAHDAVRSDTATQHKWKTAGIAHAAFYVTEDAMKADKKRILAEGILPALDKRIGDALNKDLPRKGSKDYNALDSEGLEKWESAMEAKINARAYANEYLKRLIAHAFPSDSASEPKVPRDLRTRIMEEIAALVKACQKAEEADFDLMATIASLQNVEAVVVSTTVSE